MKNKKAHESHAHSHKATEQPLKSNSLFSKLLPHIAAILIFIAITFLYFSPSISGDKVLNQGDILQGRGASKELADYRATHNGEEALWTNSMFGGMPAFQISVYYHGNLERYIDSIFSLDFPHPAELLFIALLGFYFLMLALDINPWLSIVGSIGFALSSYDLVILNAGHNSKMGALGYAPMVLAGVLLIFYRRKYLLGTAVSAAAISLEIRANHLQISYYLFLIILVFGITEFIATIYRKDWKHFFISTGLLVLCAVFGILSNLSLLWSTADYAAETIRGKSELTSNTQSNGGLDEDYAFGWSYGKMETFTLLIPDFVGGSSNGELSESSNTADALKKQGASGEQLTEYLRQMPLYWGEQPFTSGPAYLGALICFLFVLGMFLLKDELKWWLFSASVLAILLSWGHNFFWFSNLFFHYFPAYNKFRTVTMILVIPQVTFPLLGLLTVSKIIKGEFDSKEVISKLKIAVYITGGLCLFFIVLGGAFLDFTCSNDKRLPDWLVSALVADRASLMRIDAIRSLAFILLGAALIWLFVQKRIQSTVFFAGMILLVFVDMYPVGKRYLSNEDFVSKSDYDANFTATPADEQIMQDKSLDYRVLNFTSNTFNDSRTSYFHKSVGGYHAAKLRRYQELIENQISKQDEGVINMMNTKYFIVSAGKDQPARVQPNYGALGNAWFPDSVMMVANADEEMNRVGSMYEIKMLNGNDMFTVNGKPVNSAFIGNHDAVKIDTVTFDVSEFQRLPGAIDTLGITQRAIQPKDPSAQPTVGKYIALQSKGGTDKPFTVKHFYDFNPRKYAIVDKRFSNYLNGYTPAKDSTRSIKLDSYEPNDLVYESKSAKEGLAVFSEIYYDKGWKSYIDGKEVPHIRANYVLRAMRIPAGEHKIEFKFEPQSYFLGEKVAFASSLLVLLLLVGVLGKDFMDWRKSQS